VHFGGGYAGSSIPVFWRDYFSRWKHLKKHWFYQLWNTPPWLRNCSVEKTVS